MNCPACSNMAAKIVIVKHRELLLNSLNNITRFSSVSLLINMLHDNKDLTDY